MARPTEGWTTRLPRGSTVHTVRFRHQGRTVERSTGERDPTRAAKAAARIYAAAQRGERLPDQPRTPRRQGDDLEELAAQWLKHEASRLDPETIATYAGYFDSLLVAFFSTLSGVTPPRVRDYIAERLSKVRAPTVRKELSPLRGLLAWAYDEPPELPGVPKRATGTAYKVRRREQATELSPAEVRRLLDALPEWSSSRRVAPFPIRARFVLAYETSLRPATLDALSVPEHYRPGSRYLRIPPELDKARAGRPVPLTAAARKALRSVCPKAGLIFGRHDYRDALEKAATAARIPKFKRDTLAPYDVRHGAITHWLESPTGNLVAVQYMAGHKHASTTSRYIKASTRAAEAMLGIGKRR